MNRLSIGTILDVAYINKVEIAIREINSVTNIDDEKKWGTLFNVFVGGMLSCIISALISVANDERQWKYYTIATVVLFILSVFSWNEYIRFKNKREEKLKELLGEY